MDQQDKTQRLKRILHADDEPDLLMIVRVTLERYGGCEVLSCANGMEVLEKAPVFKPDLILLDQTMPKLDGLETLRRLKTDPATADIPVIFITALAMQQDVERYQSLGAVGCIEKPFRPLAMFDLIKNIIAKPAS